MDYKIYKINNGYKVGRKDGQRLGDAYDNRLYITKKPMRREGAKRLLCKLEMAEKGIVMNVKSKKKKFDDGFMRIDPIKSKKKRHHGHPTKDIIINLIEMMFWPVQPIGHIDEDGNPISAFGTNLQYI